MKLAFYIFTTCAFVACAPPREPRSTTTTSSSSAPLVPDADDAESDPSNTVAGTIAGMPFKAKAALAGKNADGSIWVDVFEADVPCDRRSLARTTRVSLSTDWPEGKSADAQTSFVVYDSAGSSVTKPFTNAKTTFGKKPTKDAPGAIQLSAAGEDGNVHGAATVRWCD